MNIKMTAYEGGARLKKHGLEILVDGAADIEAMFKLNGVSIGSGYLASAVGVGRGVGLEWVNNKVDLQPNLPREDQVKLIMTYRLISITRTLKNEKGKLLASKLEILTGDNLDPSNGGVSASREVLFELEALARLRQLSKSATLRDGAGSDILLTYQKDMQVECKYLNSKNPKTVLDRIGDACKQTKRLPGTVGLIAIEVDPFISHAALMEQPTGAAAYAVVEKETGSLFRAINEQSQDILELYQDVKGVLLMAHAITRVNRKNCIDVGICNVTNSATAAPSGSKDFELVLAVAGQLRGGLPQ